MELFNPADLHGIAELEFAGGTQHFDNVQELWPSVTTNVGVPSQNQRLEKQQQIVDGQQHHGEINQRSTPTGGKSPRHGSESKLYNKILGKSQARSILQATYHKVQSSALARYQALKRHKSAGKSFGPPPVGGNNH